MRLLRRARRASSGLKFGRKSRFQQSVRRFLPLDALGLSDDSFTPRLDRFELLFEFSSPPFESTLRAVKTKFEFALFEFALCFSPWKGLELGVCQPSWFAERLGGSVSLAPAPTSGCTGVRKVTPKATTQSARSLRPSTQLGIFTTAARDLLSGPRVRRSGFRVGRYLQPVARIRADILPGWRRRDRVAEC
jgi:hypothetical protein